VKKKGEHQGQTAKKYLPFAGYIPAEKKGKTKKKKGKGEEGKAHFASCINSSPKRPQDSFLKKEVMGKKRGGGLGENEPVHHPASNTAPVPSSRGRGRSKRKKKEEGEGGVFCSDPFLILTFRTWLPTGKKKKRKKKEIKQRATAFPPLFIPSAHLGGEELRKRGGGKNAKRNTCFFRLIVSCNLTI